MTLKGQCYALCFKTRASFGAHHENLNEDRLYYQRKSCSDSRFWQYKVYADIRGGSQDICNFSLDLSMPVSIHGIHYTGTVCRTRFQDHVYGL